MKNAIFSVLATASILGAAGCTVAQQGTDLSTESTASASEAFSQALTFLGKGDSCGTSASLRFDGVDAANRQRFEIDFTNSRDIGTQGCVINASLSLAQHFNLRITGIEFSGNEFYGPQSSGNVFTFFGLQTTPLVEQIGTRTGGTAFSTVDFNFANNATACQIGFFSQTLFLEPFVSLASGTFGSAQFDRIAVFFEATPC